MIPSLDGHIVHLTWVLVHLISDGASEYTNIEQQFLGRVANREGESHVLTRCLEPLQLCRAVVISHEVHDMKRIGAKEPWQIGHPLFRVVLCDPEC